ncbi:DUF4825 domain-containing protein [Halobacillus seohaensis]|uniref:DUF4825 domain-containing protein n=1 Tax=Halobacillus seohaensis TaxID=447421 RepID=A0ABW2EUM6_9BACI
MKIFQACLLLTLTATLLIACTNDNNNEKQMRSINDVNITGFKEYVGTYVGGNRVTKIIGKLPGGESYKEVDLSNEMIKVTYGYNGGMFSETNISEYWFDGNGTVEKNFLFNAMLLTILVPNSERYHFTIDESSFSVSRENMVQLLSENLDHFLIEEEILKNEAMAMFLDENKEATEKLLEQNKQSIGELVKSTEFRKQFFEKFPIKDS